MIRKIFRKFKSTFLTTTAGRLKLLILASGLLIFFLAGSILAVQATSKPEFCISCHEMKPEYYTWKASAHNQLECVRCHVGPGLENIVRHKIGAMEQIYTHFTESYFLPITMKEELDNDICLTCHTIQRVVTPSGDITLPHAMHVDVLEVRCTECHGAVAHGDIARRQLTLDGNFDSWTVATGEAQMVRDNTKPKMGVCMECHKARGAPRNCDACHTEIGDPESHQVKNWLTTHGKLAMKDLDNCKQCHSYANMDINVEDPAGGSVSMAAEYSRRNPFCFECHARKPPSHQSDYWNFEHAGAAQPNSDKCLVCHSVGRPVAAVGTPAKTYCNQCHSGQHRGNWKQQHPRTVRTEGGVTQECFVCHSERQCARCHMAGK